MHDKVLSQKILNNTKNSMKLAMKENILTKTKLACIYSALFNRNLLMLLFSYWGIIPIKRTKLLEIS